MADTLSFDRSDPAKPGAPLALSERVTRLLCPNPGPFTFTGTNTYLIGTETVAILDPGPRLAAHEAAIRAALDGRPVSHVVVTHTHADHSPLARTLASAFDVPVIGCGPHFAARPLADGEDNALDAAADHAYQPDIEMNDGDTLAGDGFTLEAIATPGHTMNHLCFGLIEENALFSGDHVMAWSTSIVAPPDGAMRAYLDSLAKLLHRDYAVFWPGHGPALTRPAAFMRGLLAHRHQRAQAIRNRLKAGDRTIAEMVPKIYAGVDPALHGAAALSVFAQMEDLVERGEVITDGPPLLQSLYQLAGD